MKRILQCVGFSLACASLAHADTYTLTTTAKQQRALAHVVAAHNAAQPMPVTIGEYVQSVLDSVLENYERQRQESDTVGARALKEKYESATPAVRQQIDILLK